MKIIFFGTSNFAVPSLKRLARSRHKILAVVTQPDRRKGRHLKLTPLPVKVAAQKMGLTIYQPQKSCGPEFVKLLEKFKGAGSRPDLFVVVAYGQILSRELLEIPSIYCINLHGSLLPKYRGAAPVNRAIINGERATGLTVIRMNEYMDRGDIILKREVPIEKKENSLELSERLSEIGAELLVRAADSIEAGNVTLTAQDESQATYAPKLKKEDGLIDWNEPAEKIQNRVRGLIPWPAAYAYINGKLLKIWEVAVEEGNAGAGAVEQAGPGAGAKEKVQPRPEPGQVLSLAQEGIVVAAGKGSLVIKELQLEGARKMDAQSFSAGHKIKMGYILGK